jgi:hypothetical protein
LAVAFVVLVATVLAPCRVRGEDSEQDDEPSTNVIDRGHAAVSRGVEAVADRMDSFFQDRRFEETYNQTRIRIGIGGLIATQGRSEFEPGLRLDLRLSALSDRLSFVVAGGRDDDIQDDRLSGEDDGGGAGFLRFFITRDRRAQLSIDAGLAFRPSPDPFTRLRGSYAYPIGKFLLRPTQFLFWERRDGLGFTSRLELDRRFGQSRLARLRGEVERSQEGTDGYEWKAIISFQRLTWKSSGWRARFRVRGATDPPQEPKDYRVQFLYRWLAYSKWLFIDIEPELMWRRNHDWEISPGISLRLEALFGGPYLKKLEERVEGKSDG